MAGERERAGSGWMPPWVWREHEARYDFAARFVAQRVVLDCACGAAVGSRRFARAGARHVMAMDIDPANVTRIAAERDATLSFAVASACALPVRSGSIDVFVCLETIEHVDDDGGVVAEAARVLKPDGVFICSTPNRNLTNPGTTLEDRPLNRFHRREYSSEEFLHLLRARFGSVEAWGQNPSLGLVPAVLARTVPAKLAGRLGQVLKLPRLVFDPGDHAVRPFAEARAWEYVTAVCRHPRAVAP